MEGLAGDCTKGELAVLPICLRCRTMCLIANKHTLANCPFFPLPFFYFFLMDETRFTAHKHAALFLVAKILIRQRRIPDRMRRKLTNEL